MKFIYLPDLYKRNDFVRIGRCIYYVVFRIKNHYLLFRG